MCDGNAECDRCARKRRRRRKRRAEAHANALATGAAVVAAKARASALRKTAGGKLASKRSRTGDARCSAAMSTVVNARHGKPADTGMSLGDAHAMLGKCRSMARQRRAAEGARAGGHEARAQHREHNAARGLTLKERASRAKELRAQRAAPKAERFGLKRESTAGTKRAEFEATGAGRTPYMFDMKRGDLPGQTTLMDRYGTTQVGKPSSRAEGRNTPERLRAAARLRKARERAKEAGKGKGDPADRIDHPPGYLGDLKTEHIQFDPTRFQYKLAQTNTQTGAVGSLAGVKKWDPELAGVVSVWRDPANGKVYVVNGHNRLDLAKKLGVDKVAVRYLDAPDHVTARAKGALANIAEGRGSSTDAAKFFRDSGITSKAELESRGIPLTEGKTNEGLALAGLNDNLFRRVIDGSLPVSKGAIIGGGGLKPEQQQKVAQLFEKSKGRMTDAELREYVDDARLVGSRAKDDGPGLFGKDDGPDEESLLGHRVKLIVGVKQRLSREKNLFGTVSRQRSASTLERGGNVINTEQSGRIAADANEALLVFDSLKRTSVFSGALNEHARRLAGAKGDKSRREIEEELYREIRKRVKNAYDLRAAG